MGEAPLKNSDGSAEWNAGQPPQAIRVVCSVNGPIEAKLRDELPQLASVELVYRRNIGLPMIREQLIQDRLHTCLLSVVRRDLLPRSLIQVVVQLLEAWAEPADLALAAEISEGVNCLSVALARSGIPMRGLVVARSYYIDENGEVWPTTVPAHSTVRSTHAAAFTHNDGAIRDLVMVESTGEFSQEQLLAVLTHARDDAAETAAAQASEIHGHQGISVIDPGR